MNAHSACGCGKCIPPDIMHIEIYFLEKGISLQQARAFYHAYATKSWRNSKGEPIRNWKVHAWEWAWLYRPKKHD